MTVLEYARAIYNVVSKRWHSTFVGGTRHSDGTFTGDTGEFVREIYRYVNRTDDIEARIDSLHIKVDTLLNRR